MPTEPPPWDSVVEVVPAPDDQRRESPISSAPAERNGDKPKGLWPSAANSSQRQGNGDK